MHEFKHIPWALLVPIFLVVFVWTAAEMVVDYFDFMVSK